MFYFLFIRLLSLIFYIIINDVFFQSVPTEVAVNSDMFLQTLAEVIIMISPISPSFASELWEGYTNRITSCSTCDMVCIQISVLNFIFTKTDLICWQV